MRSFLPIMSQWISHSKTFNNFEYAIIRYGQLIIYLLAIAVIGYFYLVSQKSIADFMESIQVSPTPQF